MKILHINSYFATRPLHLKYVEALDRKLVEQIIYIPIGKVEDYYKFGNKDSLKYGKIIYSKCFNSISRIFWPLKMILIWNNFNRLIHFKDIQLVHAHSLIVNGLIAFFVNKKRSIPYVVTVRNSDINFFIKRSFIFRKIAEKILLNAESIITLSPAYKDVQIKTSVSSRVYNKIKDSITVIPNGIDDFWFNNNHIKNEKNNRTSIIFVGEINKNKNLEGLILACNLLWSTGKDFVLNVVGTGPLYKKLKKNNDKIKFWGQINDKTKLKEIYRSSDILVVPSINESFGLVYPEAMSQGLPVIYSKGQGFDGFYNDGYVGYAVDPRNPLEISQKILQIIKKFECISRNASENALDFSWNNQALKTINLYKTII